MLTDKLLLNNDQFFTEVARMLAGGNSVTLRAKGNSMYPFIVDGRDSVILQTCRKTAAVGDIVLAHLPEKGFVLHRIYKNDGNEFVLMGDGNLHTTERCSKNDIVGKVVKIIRNGRYIDCSSSIERYKATLWRKMLPTRRYLLFACRWWVKRNER